MLPRIAALVRDQLERLRDDRPLRNLVPRADVGAKRQRNHAESAQRDSEITPSRHGRLGDRDGRLRR